MLVRLVVANVLSFYERTEFNMLPNFKKQKFQEHIYMNQPVPVLKMAAIYGANGAGKTNLLKVLDFVDNFVREKNFLSWGLIKASKFNLIECNDRPISIIVEFIVNQTCFYYEIKISSECGIKQETLSLSGCGEKEDQILFTRNRQEGGAVLKLYDENGADLSNDTISEVVSNYFEKNPLCSTFAMFEELGIVKNKTIKKAFSWFTDKLTVLDRNPQSKSIFELFEQEAFSTLANKMIQNMDVGITEIRITKESLPEYIARFEDESHTDEKFQQEKKRLQEVLASLEDISEQKKIMIQNGERLLYKEDGQWYIKSLEFSHSGRDEYIGKLGWHCQSDGTQQLVHLLPLLYSLTELSGERVFCIDEIESSIHPINIKEFISAFARNSESTGQLIFTTHECHLLDQQNLMRPDEVWFSEKRNGETALYSLNDFKEHNTIDIEKGYLAGRYGAIPYLGSPKTLG